MDDILKPVSQDEFNFCIESLGPWGNDDEKLPPIVLAVSGVCALHCWHPVGDEMYSP